MTAEEKLLDAGYDDVIILSDFSYDDALIVYPRTTERFTITGRWSSGS